ARMAGLIEQWDSAVEEPSIGAIKPAQAQLVFAGFSRGGVSRAQRSDLVPVIGVNEVDPIPRLELFERPARMVQVLLIGVEEFAVRSKYADQACDVVDDQTRLALLLAERLFSALAIVDVGQKDIPAGDLTSSVVHRDAARI